MVKMERDVKLPTEPFTSAADLRDILAGKIDTLIGQNKKAWLAHIEQVLLSSFLFLFHYCSPRASVHHRDRTSPTTTLS